MRIGSCFIVIFAILLIVKVQKCKGSSADIDSLKLILRSSKNNENITLNQKIADSYYFSNYDSSLFYAQEALELAQKINDNTQVIKALILLAKVNNSIGNHKHSLQLFNQAKELCIKDSNYELLASVYIEITRYYNSKFNYNKVIATLDSALKIINKNNIKNLKPYAFNHISTVHININDIPSAKYYANSVSELALPNYNPEVMVHNLHIKARISNIEDTKQLSLDLLKKSLELSKKSKKENLTQLSYRRLAGYYIDFNSYDTAVTYIDSSIMLCNKLGYNIEKSALLTYKAHIEWMKNNFENSLKYNLEALKIRKSTGHKSSISSSLLNIGGNYTELGDYSLASKYLESGLEIAEEQKILKFIIRGYEKLGVLYELQGNYENALYYSNLKTR